MKTQQCGFRTGPTQTELHKHKRWVEVGNFEFMEYRNCTVREAKTKALISLAVTAKLICAFGFAQYTNCWFLMRRLICLLNGMKNIIRRQTRKTNCLYILDPFVFSALMARLESACVGRVFDPVGNTDNTFYCVVAITLDQIHVYSLSRFVTRFFGLETF